MKKIILKNDKSVEESEIIEQDEKTEENQKVEKNKKNYLSFAKKAARCLFDKKMKDILVLDVRGKCDIADFFVIATGNSNTHISSVPSYIKSELLKFNKNSKPVYAYRMIKR